LLRLGGSMMIDQTLLRRLAGFDSGTGAVTSVMLCVDGARYRTRDEYLTALKALLGQARQEFREWYSDRSLGQSLEEDVSRIESFVTWEFQRGAYRGLAIWCQSSAEFWEVLPLRWAPRDEILVDRYPLLRQLVRCLNSRRNAILLLLERAAARILTVRQGVVDDELEITSDVPSQVREGGFQGFAERRISRHVDEHVSRHLQKVAAEVRQLVDRHQAGEVLVGGSESVVAWFCDSAAHWVPGVCVRPVELSFAQDVRAVDEYLERLDAAENLEREKKLLEQWAKARASGLAVAGAIPTLRCLQRGQVDTLLLENDYRQQGWRCEGCGLLTTENGPECPLCQGHMVLLADMGNAALCAALRQGCNVEVIERLDPGESWGGMASILRFPL